MAQWRFGGLLTNESHPVLTSVPIDRNGFGFVSHRSAHCGLGLQDSGSQARARGIFDISCRILEANVCPVFLSHVFLHAREVPIWTLRQKHSAVLLLMYIYSMLLFLHKVAQSCTKVAAILQRFCSKFCVSRIIMSVLVKLKKSICFKIEIWIKIRVKFESEISPKMTQISNKKVILLNPLS